MAMLRRFSSVDPSNCRNRAHPALSWTRDDLRSWLPQHLAKFSRIRSGTVRREKGRVYSRGMTTATNLSAPRRFLTWLAPIEPREVNAVIAAFLLFFFMWYGYFSVRPVREAIGTQLGRDTVTALWWYNAAFSVLLIPLYGTIVGRFRRSTFLPWIYGFVGLVLALVGLSK